MTDRTAFLRAIEANPEDNDLRLVYSDWLEEHGTTDADRARAELIRVQCELAHSGSQSQDLVAREAELLRTYTPVWRKQYAVFPRWPQYHRGFLDPVTVVSRNFLRAAPRLAAITPLHHVILSRAPSQMQRLAGCPQLEHVRSLVLENNDLRDDHIVTLASSPHLNNLTMFDLTGNHIGIAGCQALAEADLPGLRTLFLGRNPIQDRGLGALLEAHWLDGLTLCLVDCELGWQGAELLARCQTAGRLKRLAVAPRDNAPLRMFLTLASAPFTALEWLALGTIPELDPVIHQLAANPALTNLQGLHLGGRSLSDQAVRALLDSPYLSGLQCVRIPFSDLSFPVQEEARTRFAYCGSSL